MNWKYLSILVCLPCIIYTQTPKRELRAAWIATVFNIDWPSTYGLSSELQKKELLKILDGLEKMKFNAAILQVKPTSDAFYQSKLSPWSKYLMGKQGDHPGYDPLEFFIEEAHKRNIETHVWINPFRILNGENFNNLSQSHIAYKNPQWVIEYNKRYYFDPGNPAVQNYVIKEVLEIVKNYDIDAVHMDDYFYPYKIRKNNAIVEFNDNASWEKYGYEKFQNRADWRRNNIDQFVKTLSEQIKNTKYHVKFGISPFGVWRNKSIDSRGSETKAGQTNYDDLYADVLKWIDNRWIDYVMPQIYWHFDTKGVPFDVLVEWWSAQTQNKINLYIGLGVYKLKEQNWPISHVKDQVDFIRNNKEVGGQAYYSAKWLINNTKGISSYVTKDLNESFALVPTNKNLKKHIPQQPEHFDIHIENNKALLTWKNKDPQNIRYFVIYRFPKDKDPDICDARNIVGVVSAKKKLEYQIADYSPNNIYGITSVSRLHYESPLLTLEESQLIIAFEKIDAVLSSK